MTDDKTKYIEMPLIPLRGISVFPYMVLHFDVGRERSIKALEQAMIKDQRIFLTSQKNIEVETPKNGEFYEIGTVCKIKQMLKLPGDAIRVLVEGLQRARVKTLLQEKPYFFVLLETFTDEIQKDREIEALMRSCLSAFDKYIAVKNRLSLEIVDSIAGIDNPGRFADILASHMVLKTHQKQRLIDAIDAKERLNVLYEMLISEIEILEVEKDINDRVRRQINQLQKEYYLREQMKVIREELGEENLSDVEAEEMKETLKKMKVSKKIKEKIEKEIDRYARMPSSSAEATVVRTYIKTVLELPFQKTTKDRIDIKKARGILDEDHYALKQVKERILEYLAVRELTKSMKGPILCLVGPPGVGKTSIAKSVARALNRKFVRMSLGGVRDEAEIRGHRRTYVGAIPGRIINGIKEAGTKNPVFLFDEIDKLANDFRGDPASALLEVLDPEQNKDFTDHYLEVPFDLSKVMFITTANNLATIPRPLLDRMEVIRIGGYTEEEKLQIAKKYLLPKQLKENGLTDDNLVLSSTTIREIINSYTREAGVRELERQIATVCRKVATRIVEEKIDKVKVTTSNLHKSLGTPKYHHDKIEDKDAVGMATGLAWTAVGGETLSIEVVPMKGKGKLSLTGKMGDVMKESAQAGLSYIRSVAHNYNLTQDFHEKIDLHIHIPEGAIPKDGPSAGITMATAVLSSLTEIPVRKDVAMTGEITLRGRVLPIGGLKEKALAAKRAGIKTIIFPKDNVKDLDDIDDKVKKTIKFVPVSNMDEVLKYALSEPSKKVNNAKKKSSTKK